MGLSVKMSFNFGINKQAAEIYPLKVVKHLCLQRLFSTAMTYWLLPAKTPESCLHCEILHCVFVFGVILVQFFPHSDWIRRDAELRSISPYSVQMRENADQNNSEYGHFSYSVSFNEHVNKKNQINK